MLSQEITRSKNLPWIPLGEGKSFKPLRFLKDGQGFVELLKLEPGQEISWHRHTGEVHAFHLTGFRQLHTGEVVEPQDYVYEPAGNIDRWKVSGEEPLVIFVVVMGAVEYLDENQNVVKTFTSHDLRHCYEAYCHAENLEPMDLT